MLEQMLAKKLSSSTKVPKTMTIKTGATKKSTATRSASAGATKGRKGGRRGGNGSDPPSTEEAERRRAAEEATTAGQEQAEGQPGAAEAPNQNPEENFKKSMTFVCNYIDPDKQKTGLGGYRKKMSSKRPMSATPTKKSSCSAMSTKPTKKSMSTKPKSAKK
jgi:hypothetical protein